MKRETMREQQEFDFKQREWLAKDLGKEAAEEILGLPPPPPEDEEEGKAMIVDEKLGTPGKRNTRTRRSFAPRLHAAGAAPPLPDAPPPAAATIITTTFSSIPTPHSSDRPTTHGGRAVKNPRW